jgi:hypothetical protein
MESESRFTTTSKRSGFDAVGQGAARVGQVVDRAQVGAHLEAGVPEGLTIVVVASRCGKASWSTDGRARGTVGQDPSGVTGGRQSYSRCSPRCGHPHGVGHGRAPSPRCSARPGGAGSRDGG